MNEPLSCVVPVRLIKLSIADFPTDDRTSPLRTVWVNPVQIETVVEYVTWSELEPVLWLELTLATGTVLHQHIGPVTSAGLDAVVEHAVGQLSPTWPPARSTIAGHITVPRAVWVRGWCWGWGGWCG